MSVSSDGTPKSREICPKEQNLVELQEENSILRSGLETIADQLIQLRESLTPKADVPINKILGTVTKTLGLPQTEGLGVTRHQIQYADRLSLQGRLRLRGYYRTRQLEDSGFTLKHLAIIRIFLSYVTTESSESQHLPSVYLLEPLLFSFY